jgi:predicted DNA-binding transcriptional regulator YafY
LRELEPWGLTSKFGHWYVVGFDRGAGDMRVYRADRIEDDIETDAAGGFTVPADFRADSSREDRPWDYGEGRSTDVVVQVDPGYEVAFCQAVGPDARVEPMADGTTRVTIRAVEIRAVVNFVLGFLDHVQIVEPAEARDAVIAALDAWAAA